jgi:hypothetical protein
MPIVVEVVDSSDALNIENSMGLMDSPQVDSEEPEASSGIKPQVDSEEPEASSGIKPQVDSEEPEASSEIKPKNDLLEDIIEGLHNIAKIGKQIKDLFIKA